MRSLRSLIMHNVLLFTYIRVYISAVSVLLKGYKNDHKRRFVHCTKFQLNCTSAIQEHAKKFSILDDETPDEKNKS